MSYFHLRMELHKEPNKTVTAADYQALHDLLNKEDFFETINWNNDENIYELPTGTYRYAGSEDISLDQAEMRVKRAGEAIKKTPDVKDYTFFLTEYNGTSRRHNLRPIGKKKS
jgi:glutamate/tyrosine decarboxylase-like PLP-dependent enzyme